MENNKNIWLASLTIAKKNYKFIIIYLFGIVILAIVDEHIQSRSANTIGIIFVSSILAIPSHLSILSQLSPSEWMRELQRKNPTYITNFVFRLTILGVISFAPVFILIFILIRMDWEKNLVVLATVPSLLLLAALVFAKWGTVLPAILMQDDRTFSRAGKRGSLSFLYAFPRLLLSFVALSILQLVCVIFSVTLLDAGETFFTGAGYFDFSLLFSVLIGATVGAYQVIITSVILSRAYLRVENAENRSDTIPVLQS